MKQFKEYSLFIDYDSGPEEAKVYHMLTMICATKIGKLLLDSLKAGCWIQTLDDKHRAKCNCAGLTLPSTPDRGKGHDKNSNLFLEVTDQPMLQTDTGLMYQYYSDDDRLFHELVHVYRMGCLGFYGMNYDTMTNYLNPEEFLAVHMQNVYLASRGNPRFYIDFKTMQAVSKEDAYTSFTADPEALKFFQYFVSKDTFDTQVAAFKDPALSFNPWRDYGSGKP
jgi:hypothetical protein